MPNLSERHLPRICRLASVLALPALLLAGCGSESEQSSCVKDDGCPADRSVHTDGFTDNTGWQDEKSCCDICEGMKKVNCFDEATCGNKTGNDDWDFLVLDQIWLPQLCAAFDQGHDPTLTHTESSKCSPLARRRSGLSIHGLWPNYVNGFPQCCRPPASLAPSELPADIQIKAEEMWVDPAFKDGDCCSFCSMWAHEYLKHGNCLTNDMASYFNITTLLTESIGEQQKQLEALLATAGPVETSAIEGVFKPFSIEVVCDPQDMSGNETVGVLLELRTCWSGDAGVIRSAPFVGNLKQQACPTTQPPSCPSLVMVRQPPEDEQQFA